MTLFEKIIAGEIPAEFAHEDDMCVAIHDLNCFLNGLLAFYGIIIKIHIHFI